MHESSFHAREELANCSTHGLALVGACVATPQLLESAQHLSSRAYAGVAIFAATMVLLYGASTVYHALPPGKAKHYVLRLDHAAIYLFIAGSYTPFALCPPSSPQSVATLYLVWAAAAAGFLMKALAVNLAKVWSTCLYVAMGWLVLVTALPLIQAMPPLGTAWLIMGGVTYTVGVLFFMLDATVRYAHALWHTCVAAGTTCHVFAVLNVMAHASV